MVGYCPRLITAAKFEEGGKRDMSRYAGLGVGKEVVLCTV
jgi:hypothetical protein